MYVVAYEGGDGYYPAKANSRFDAIREFRLIFGYDTVMLFVHKI